MGLLETIKTAASGLLEPVAKVIDDIHTSEEERLVLKAQIAQAQVDLESRLYEAETARLTAVNATMQAEAKSDKWLASSWRPLFGISFGVQLWFMWLLVYQRGMAGVQMIAALPEMYWYSNLALLGVVAAGRSWEKIQARRARPAAG